MEKTFNRSFDVVFKRCKEALEELELEIDSSSKAKGFIEASTGSSFLSWGEDIEISIRSISEKKTKVIVESSASAQVFSWGKNDSNESAIIEKLTELLAQ